MLIYYSSTCKICPRAFAVSKGKSCLLQTFISTRSVRTVSKKTHQLTDVQGILANYQVNISRK